MYLLAIKHSFIKFTIRQNFQVLDKLELNKIAARWPAKAVAQFSTSSKKTVDIYLHKKYC